LRAADSALDLVAVRQLLADAVREGGALALGKFRQVFKSWTKEFDSPVSEVDIAVDELLRARLGAFSSSFGWLSEESVDDPARLDAAHVWIVDPIDGTRAYIAGREDWVISAALAHNGRPVAGAIYVPVADRLFLAVAGEGATVNGVPVLAGPGTRQMLLAAGPKRHIDALAAAGLQVETEPRVRSLALRLARVADASLDVAFAGGNSRDWDIAAADLIVHEAGGALTDLAGRPVIYNRPDPVHDVLVASDRARHAEVVKAVASHTSPQP
jgi:myo-inositol-1(or 4)-monophosphatase